MAVSKISVVVCTHNPREDYLTRTLEALQVQTLHADNWELIVVDNASTKALASYFDISWHPSGRHVREVKLGLTHARLRGIAESSGDIVVFVDDDNVLAPDFLDKAITIAEQYTFLGAWGGSIVPEFDETPPDWTKPYWGSIAIREVHIDRWSNIPEDWGSTPIGAGLCVRRTVVERYFRATSRSTVAQGLDRVGKDGLGGAGDEDIVASSLELGLGKGVFKELFLTHLIPSSRLNLDYLLKLCEQGTRSGTLLQYKNHGTWRPVDKNTRFFFRVLVFLVHRDFIGLRFYIATRKGVISAGESLK